MKKKLLHVCLFAGSVAIAQSPSPDWSNLQATNFPQPSAGIRYLDAVNDNVVWATGYDGMSPSSNYNWFTTTSNGGTNFTSGNVFPDTNTYVIASIEGIDANTAWVTAYEKAGQNKGVIYKTTNAGSTWADGGNSSMFSNASSFADLTCFVSSSVGITLGDPISSEFEIYRTTDAGSTWSVVPGANIPNANSGEYGLVDVYTKLGNNIWFGTNTGRVYHSADGGLNWTVSAITGASQGVTRLTFRDANNGLAIAYSGSSSSPVFGLYNTIDGGVTWTHITPDPTNIGMNDISAVQGTNVFVSCGAASGNTILSYSTDNGKTWTDWGSTGIQYLKIDMASANSGWAGTFSDNASATVGGIYKYSGTTLSLKPTAIAGSDLNVYPNPSNGVITMQLPVAKEGMTIEIIDALGKIVYSEKTTSQVVAEKKQINLEFLPKGLYTVSVKKGNLTSYSKIVLQ